ncbi:MAG: glycoside hydrolase family 95-like protein [Prolixibacteraceae bacterium]
MKKIAFPPQSSRPMSLNFGLASLLLILSIMSVVGQEMKSENNIHLRNQVDYRQFLAQHDLIWEELPLQWNEGAFTGNAHLGMMVFATLKENRIDFHIGRQDVTDHRKAPDKKSSIGTPGAGGMYDFPRLDVGRLALIPAGKIISGTMRIDLWNAEIRTHIVTSLGELSFRAFTPYQEIVQIIEVSSTEKDQGKPVHFQWKFLPGNPSSPRAIVFPDNKESKEYATNPKPVLAKENNVNLCVQSLIAGGDYATAWTEKKGTKVGQTTLYLTTANEVPASGISGKVALKTLDNIINQPVAKVEKVHRESWHQFYSKSFLSIPDARMESFYWIQLYKMGTCSRPDAPAVDLNGPYFRVTQWPALWWNLNVQLTYWIVYESNHLEMGENLITLIDECFETLLTRFNGPKLGDLTWTMHNYWLQFRYSGNRKAIQEKWVPKAIKIAALYEKMERKEPSGKIGLAPMESPEYNGFKLYTNSSYNLAIYRWLLSTLIESCESAGTNPSLVAKWKNTLANLVPFATDENGIRIGSDQAVDMSHRHYSHLLGLYPLFQLNPDSPEDRALVDKSVVHWHKIGDGKGLAGYSYTGAASLYAALGRGNDSESILTHFLTGSIGISQLLSNTFYVESGGKNPVIETPLSAAASIMEMLLQSWGNKIRIFPAVPDSWKNAAFNELRAQGGFLVSTSRSEGKTTWVQIKSLAGEPCVVKIPGWTNAFQAGKGRKFEISPLGNNEFSINLGAGEEILLAPSHAPVNAVLRPVKHLTDEKNLYGVKKGKQLPNNQNWPEPIYEVK